jgi:hypothetical protein
MTLLYSLIIDFPEFDPLTATGMALESKFRRGDGHCGTLYFVVLMKYKLNYISVTPLIDVAREECSLAESATIRHIRQEIHRSTMLGIVVDSR